MAVRPTVYTDEDVLRLLGADPAFVVGVMRRAVQGELVAPARIHADLGGATLSVTAGRLPGEVYGYRSYDTFPGEQVVTVLDDQTRTVECFVVGRELGSLRTGGLGGVAVDLLADPDATTIGVIGTGREAWAQLWAINAVRSLSEVSVFARTEEKRVAFAERVCRELGVSGVSAGSAQEAVADKDIVVLATSSGTPVIDAAWVKDGAHVTTVGYKYAERHELPLELLDRGAVVATDSVAQMRNQPVPDLLSGTRHAERLVALGAVPARAPEDITVYLSAGLAGTEVVLAHAMHLRHRCTVDREEATRST